MLKGISPLISPDLLHALASMGHGDEIVLADGNFPAAEYGKRLIRLDGHGVTAILKACLELIPLDQYVDQPVGLMQVVPGDPTVPAIWEDYRKTIDASGSLQNRKSADSIEMIERFAFYERAKKAFAVVATGETAIYANVILKKGVVQ